MAVVGPAFAQDADLPGWLDSGDGWAENKAQLQELGEQYDSSWDLYQAFEQAANGGTGITWEQVGSDPAFDWSGIFTRTKGGLQYDPDIGSGDELTAKLTPEGQAIVDQKAQHMAETGGEYDPISDCRPPGYPRWLTEPFLHEFIVTPDQSWLVNEMVNDVRRVYTDGRDHTAPEDAYPTWNGDTIGFWDGDVLVTHTKYLMPGQYQRGVQPNYSGDITAVERWRKVDDRTLEADVWLYDPENLAEPWYTRQSWTKLTDPDHLLRIRYWDCRENENNDIIITEEGTSQFPSFDWLQDAPVDTSDSQ